MRTLTKVGQQVEKKADEILEKHGIDIQEMNSWEYDREDTRVIYKINEVCRVLRDYLPAETGIYPIKFKRGYKSMGLSVLFAAGVATWISGVGFPMVTQRTIAAFDLLGIKYEVVDRREMSHGR